MFELISRGILTTVPSESFIVTAPDAAGAAALGVTSPGAVSRQAPTSRTRSRTSGATEAHGSGCAVAAVAPVSNDALSSNPILARIVCLPVDGSGQLAHHGALFNVRPDDCIDPAQNIRSEFWYNFKRLHVFPDLLNLGSAGDHSADVRVRKTPCERQLRQGARQLAATDSSCATALFFAGSVKPSRRNA